MNLLHEIDSFIDAMEGRDVPPPPQYQPRAEETGNCPNCAQIVVRELVYQNNVPVYYWPCPHCGYTHHGPEIPALE